MIKVFIDGAEGTTGLEIRERLLKHPRVTLLDIDPALRKDTGERKKLLNSCDFAILCLPDAAAREAVALIENPAVRVIDASTAHRTADGWVYGLPELGAKQRRAIAGCKRLSNPGCHATGFVLLVKPLIDAGVITPDALLTAVSVTGYSGGGKGMIADYTAPDRAKKFDAARPYAMAQAHKHLPEMAAHAGLKSPPAFLPILGDYYKGMAVSLPLHAAGMARSIGAAALTEAYSRFFEGCPFVSVSLYDPAAAGPVDPQEQNGTNRLRIAVFGSDDRIVPTAVFDNLGKGASGAAVQSLNIMAGLEENTALV